MIALVCQIIIGCVAFLVVFFKLRTIYKKYSSARKTYKELGDLVNGPFNARIKIVDNRNYIIFKLTSQTSLWCDFQLGIRSDGIYGVNLITLCGLNTHNCGTIRLAIGESIFPIIEKMNQFDAWIKNNAFDCHWAFNFKCAWDDMKKRLDNLRMLETKSKDQENKDDK